MRKKKGKSIRKTKKKLVRPAKQTYSKASSRKKKPVRSKRQTAGVLAVKVAGVVVSEEIKPDSVDETEATVIVSLDEHYPPDYGGSE